MYSNMQPYIPDRKPPIGALLNPYLLINRGIVGDWPFWEGSGGQVFDLSGNGNTGTFSGDTIWSVGNFGPAVECIDADDSILCGNNPSLQITGPMTLVTWLTVDDFSTYPWIAAKWTSGGDERGFGMYLWDTGVPHLYLSSNGVDSTAGNGGPALTVGKLHCVAGVYTGVQMIEYVDGVPGTPKPYSSGINNSASIFQISGYGGAPIDQPLDGRYELVILYNRALSASEIALLYREPFFGFRWMSIEQLAAYYEEPPPEIQALFMDLSTQIWTIKHATGLFTKL